MRSIRIEPRSVDLCLVSIECVCGNTAMTDVESGVKEFKHPIQTDDHDVPLVCGECGKEFLLRSQHGHFHVVKE